MLQIDNFLFIMSNIKSTGVQRWNGVERLLGWKGGWGGPHQVSSKLDQNYQSLFLGWFLGGWGGLNIPPDMLHTNLLLLNLN